MFTDLGWFLPQKRAKSLGAKADLHSTTELCVYLKPQNVKLEIGLEDQDNLLVENMWWTREHSGYWSKNFLSFMMYNLQHRLSVKSRRSVLFYCAIHHVCNGCIDPYNKQLHVLDKISIFSYQILHITIRNKYFFCARVNSYVRVNSLNDRLYNLTVI